MDVTLACETNVTILWTLSHFKIKQTPEATWQRDAQSTFQSTGMMTPPIIYSDVELN